MNNTTCSSDPFPTRLLMSHLYAIVPILQHIVNLCLTTGNFPISCKSSIVIPLINPLTVTFFSLTRSSWMSFLMTKMNIVYKQLYCNIEWFINIVLVTDNMFSLSQVIIYLIEAILKYIDFIISSSIGAHTIGFIHVIILHIMF